MITMSTVQSAVAFFVAIWSFMLRLVHSFIGLFTFTKPSTNSCTLPVVREHNTASVLSQRPIHLRPIVLSQKKSVYTSFRAHEHHRFRTSSTLSPRRDDDAPDVQPPNFHVFIIPRITATDSAGVTELRCSTTGQLTTSVDSFTPFKASSPVMITSRARWTPDSPSPIRHIPVSPLYGSLTPPDRCYLAPKLPFYDSYYERWPTLSDRSAPRKPASSPLKTSFEWEAVFPEPIFHSRGPSCNTSPVKIWTSTPNKDDPALCNNSSLSASNCPATDAVVSAKYTSSATSSFDHSSFVSSESDLFDFSVYARIPDAENVNNHQPLSPELGELASHALPRKVTTSVPEVLVWRRYGTRVPGKNSSSKKWYTASPHVASPVGWLSPQSSCLSTYSSEIDNSTALTSYYANNSGLVLHRASQVNNCPREASSSNQDVVTTLHDCMTDETEHQVRGNMPGYAQPV